MQRKLNGLFRYKIPFFVLYKVCVDYFFYKYLSVRYAYISGSATPNFEKFLCSWVSFFVIMLVSCKIANTNLKIASDFLIIISAIPSLSIYWMKNENTVAFILICTYWLIFLLTSAFMSKTTIGSNYEKKCNCFIMPKTNNIIIFMCFVWVVVTTLFFSYRYGNFRLFVSFAEVYNYRMDAANYMSTIESYIYAWNTNIILPICLIVHLYNKSYLEITADLVMFLLAYSIYGNKFIFFECIYILGVWIIAKLNLKEKISQVIALALSVAFGCFYIVRNTTIGLWIQALLYRLLYIPTEAHYFYYDFFKNGEKLYLRQSVMRYFCDNPYENAVSVLIGSSTKYNMTGNYNNLNNGLFSDAYANFGIVGVLIYPIILVLIILVFANVMKEYDFTFRLALLFTLLGNVISTSLFQNLLTGGVVLGIGLLLALRETFSQNYNKRKE